MNGGNDGLGIEDDDIRLDRDVIPESHLAARSMVIAKRLMKECDDGYSVSRGGDCKYMSKLQGQPGSIYLLVKFNLSSAAWSHAGKDESHDEEHTPGSHDDDGPAHSRDRSAGIWKPSNVVDGAKREECTRRPEQNGRSY